jgi:hypothetical protein
MPHQPDLFGHTPAQGDLFGGVDAGTRTKPLVDPADIRKRLHRMLLELRAAEGRSPWSGETTRLNQLIFPQMATWLPEEERAQLCFEFDAQMKRLDLAA